MSRAWPDPALPSGPALLPWEVSRGYPGPVTHPADITNASPRALRASVPMLDRIIIALFTLTCLAMMLFSALALNALGWSYDKPGAGGLTRIHPASLLAFLTFCLLLMRDGNPISSFARMLAHDPNTAIFLVAWGMMIVHAGYTQELPTTQFIDTFFLPILTLLIYRRLPVSAHQRLAMLIHIVFFANAVLGLVEFGSGWRLTPFILGDANITWDWRSTAFFGHPLGNALLTGCYCGLLILRPARGFTGLRLALMVGLQFLAMAVFGGRTSLVLLGFFVIFAFFRLYVLATLGSGFSKRGLALAAFCLPVVAVIGFILADAGFFDKLISRFVSDDGSANARIIMFELFNGFSLAELLIAPPQDFLAYEVRKYALEFGIESLWVAFALYYGIIPSALFFCGLALFMLSVTAQSQARVWYVYLYFFTINTTFLGLGGKTVTFTILILLTLALAPRSSPRPDSPHGP